MCLGQNGYWLRCLFRELLDKSERIRDEQIYNFNFDVDAVCFFSEVHACREWG